MAQNKKQATHLHCLFVKAAVNAFLFSHMHHFLKKNLSYRDYQSGEMGVIFKVRMTILFSIKA